jgi:chaperonin GroEL (HSP60 family)
MSLKNMVDEQEVHQEFAALLNNAEAIRAVTEAVEGTLGPKGLDCMLVDGYGGLIITNDGVTILKTMDLNHPAARILMSAVEFQEEQVGDGTTTAAIVAGTLVLEGVNQVLKGVPPIKVIEGMKVGIDRALCLLEMMVLPISDLKSCLLGQLALVAARGQHDLAALVMDGARLLGEQLLRQPGFKLSEQVMAVTGPESELLQGTIIHREPLNITMADRYGPGRILILDDALEPPGIDSEALGTEIGITRWLQGETELQTNLEKLVDLGIIAVFTDRSISDNAADRLTQLGILGVSSIARQEWQRLAELSGACPIKRGSLVRSVPELRKVTGEVSGIEVNRASKFLKIFGTPTSKMVTILVGAHTKEVLYERERITKDAAGAVQAAWLGGIVSGGGSAELGITRRMAKETIGGMSQYGYDCVIQALRRPLCQICRNAGFNSLEKVVQVLAAQEEHDSDTYGIDCDTGLVEDLAAAGIWDPYFVKMAALRSAGEVAEAILRIQMIIKMKEAKPESGWS